MSSGSPTFGRFPGTRLRRNRRDDWSRRLVAENKLSVDDLIWPIFVHDGETAAEPVASMPGVNRLPIADLVDAVEEAAGLGIPMVALFPATPPERKTPDGDEATNADNLICHAVRAIKRRVNGIDVMCDVALDPYTTHGQDGLVRNNYVVNDESVTVLCHQALVQAEAGCDVIAPSDMMDGRVGAIRTALDGAGFEDVRIVSYAAKYASTFYGPFRDAVGSSANLGQGDKRTYQMDPANGEESIREVALDIAEGADAVIIKPGLPYLDIIWRVKDRFGLPVFAYQVSGEYAMVKAAGERGWIDGDQAMVESLLCFKRAGADAIITYAALDIARDLAAA